MTMTTFTGMLKYQLLVEVVMVMVKSQSLAVPQSRVSTNPGEKKFFFQNVHHIRKKSYLCGLKTRENVLKKYKK